MARKFFNSRISSQKTTMQIIIIVGSLIGIIICFLIAHHFLSKPNNNNKATIKLRDRIAVEINSNLPDKTLLFSELENVSEDEIEVSFDKVDLTKVGDYTVVIKVFGEEYHATVQVLDTQAPELILKDLELEEGKKYSLDDFIIDCTDNSNEQCAINFNDTTGIDYTAYSAPGNYVVQIVANDSSNNKVVQEANLTIKSKDGEIHVDPSLCTFGNDEYDQDQYILALKVTENGCGRDLNLYQSDILLNGVNAIMEQETEKIQKEFSKLNIEGEKNLNRTSQPVLNLTGNGLVGYTIHMEVSILNDDVEEVVESYYLNLDGSRIYSINKYNLE